VGADSLTARLVLLASGGGRTVVNFHEVLGRGQLDAFIARVIVSNPNSGALEKAENLGLPTTVIGKESHPEPEEREDALIATIRKESPDWILMAGWMNLLPIPKDFEGKTVNIHPALLPAWGGKGFWGRHVHEAVASAGHRFSGCTVHFASAEYDRGPCILQEGVLLSAHADSAIIATAVFEAEKRAYPETLRLLLQGRVRLKGSQAVWA
jgi:phosphoribosylglycinamide formyltransferase-1